MGFAENYNPNDVSCARVIPGVHKLIVTNVSQAQAKSSGKDMIVIDVKIADNEKFELKSRIIDNEYASKRLNSFFDSVKLPHSLASLRQSIGKTAWGMVQYQKELADNGKCYLELSYFVTEDQKGRLPERPNPANGALKGSEQKQTEEEFSDDIPW